MQAQIDQLRRELVDLKSYSSDYSTSRYAEAGRVSGTFLGLTFKAGVLRDAASPLTVTLANGANQDVDIGPSAVFITTSGPTGAYSIGGFAGGYVGRIIVMTFNNQALTINNADAGSLAANRIATLTAVNVVPTAGNGNAAIFAYAPNNLWVLVSIRP